MKPKIFLDADGVLADFNSAAEKLFGMPSREYEEKHGAKTFWKNIHYAKTFYRDLPLMPDARLLFDSVAHLNPTILTGCPFGGWAEKQKQDWAAEHFPGTPIITCMSKNKRDHARAGDILIDDYVKYRHLWIEMGGIFISHYDAKSSLAALFAHHPELKKD